MSSVDTPGDAPAALSAPPPIDPSIIRYRLTQIITAVDYLKNKDGPIRLEDLALLSGVEGLLDADEVLLNMFKKHERVKVDEKMGLFSYRPDYALKSTSDLITILHTAAPQGGLSAAKLRASWPGVGGAIDELEREGKVLVLRNKTGGQKNVFLDEVGMLGRGDKVDEEFASLWRGLKTPSGDALASELLTAGLSSATSGHEKSTQLGPNPKGKKKKQANRRLKITNTHLKGMGIDLSKDYVVKK